MRRGEEDDSAPNCGLAARICCSGNKTIEHATTAACKLRQRNQFMIRSLSLRNNEEIPRHVEKAAGY
jgi:hypothetical protein